MSGENNMNIRDYRMNEKKWSALCYGCASIGVLTQENLNTRVREVQDDDTTIIAEVYLCNDCDIVLSSAFCEECERQGSYVVAECLDYTDSDQKNPPILCKKHYEKEI